MKAKTIRLTVMCPFCLTAYNFKSDQKKGEWDGISPLHGGCKKTAKEMIK